MSELPLLACDSVALNIRSGRQTQHRVPIRWPAWIDKKDRDRFGDGWRTRPHERVGEFRDGLPRKSFGAPWQPGYVLYVREAHQLRHEPCTCQQESHEWYGRLPHEIAVPRGWRLRYRASGESAARWRPSIHMPKWAARTWTKPLGRVWAHRIQESTEEEARAEGVERCGGFMGAHAWRNYGSEGPACGTARDSFASLWQSLYPGSWERNDWVFACEWPGVDAERSGVTT